MRVALLFYGQPRFMGNPLPVETHYRHIIDKYETDVYVHTWWSNDVTEYDFSSWSKMDSCPSTQNAIGKILDYYDPKAINCDTPRKFSFDEQTQKYVDEMINRAIAHNQSSSPHWNEQNFSNIISQMHSIEEVTKLCQKYKQEYDFIIMSRLDNNITEFPELNDLDPNLFYSNDLHSRFPDMLYFFGQRFLDSHHLYSNLNEAIERYHKSFWEPSAEAFKLFTIGKWMEDEFAKGALDPMAPEGNLNPVRIRVYAVRDEKGDGR